MVAAVRDEMLRADDATCRNDADRRDDDDAATSVAAEEAVAVADS